MADTICIHCSNKVITRDGKKYICPNIKYSATKLQTFWEDYEVVPVNCKDRDGNSNIVDTYKVNKCKHFKQKQKHKLSSAFDVKSKQFTHPEYEKMYITVNDYEDEHKEELIEQKKLEKRIKELKEKNERKAKKEKEIQDVYIKAKENKKSYRYWTDEEKQFLIDNYITMTEEKIGLHLDRPQCTVHSMAKRLGLQKPSDKYTPEQEQAVIDYFEGKTNFKSLVKFASSMGRTSNSILQKSVRMGIRQKGSIRGKYNKEAC